MDWKADVYTVLERDPAPRSFGEALMFSQGLHAIFGETTIINDNVSIFQGVTLGGVSTSKKKRHPTIGNNVTIGANASVLGDITIGDNVKIGAGSVVVKDVPPNTTVVGIPGRVVKRNGEREKVLDLTHENLPDPLIDTIADLVNSISALEKKVEELEEKLKKD